MTNPIPERELERVVHENGPLVVDWYGESLAWRPLDYGTWTPFAFADAPRPSEGVDYRDNLARALFEAANGNRLIAWSDATRDYWLGRADAALLSQREQEGEKRDV